MRRTGIPIGIVLALFLCAPAGAAVSRHGVGGALVGGALDCDSCFDAIGFAGFAVFGKIGLTDNWGLLITYRDMEDDENLLLGEKDTYQQIGVQALHMWRPRKLFRPHVKFGIERTDFEAEIGGVTVAADDGAGLAVGGGFEAGTQRVAFFLDYDFTVVELFDEDFEIANLDLGIIFKF
jgi:hypothetical protein